MPDAYTRRCVVLFSSKARRPESSVRVWDAAHIRICFATAVLVSLSFVTVLAQEPAVPPGVKNVRVAHPPPGKEDCAFRIPAELVRKLSQPTTTAELKRAFDDLPFHDPVLDMYFWSRMRVLHPSAASDVGLLRTLPTSPLEFWHLYAVTYTSQSELADLRSAYLRYYDDVAAILPGHTAYLRDFLMQSYFADGEVAESLAEINSAINKSMPQVYAKAWKSLPDEARVRVQCPSCEPFSQPATSGGIETRQRHPASP